jgi:hypothetical protein
MPAFDKLFKTTMKVGTGIGVGANIFSGEQAYDNAKVHANALERNASTTRAATQRDAIETRRNKDYVKSRALAVLVASGGDPSDVGAINLMAEIEKEGEMMALNQLWVGEDRARGMEDSAAVTRNEGKAARTAGYTNALTTALSGYSNYKWLE